MSENAKKCCSVGCQNEVGKLDPIGEFCDDCYAGSKEEVTQEIKSEG